MDFSQRKRRIPDNAFRVANMKTYMTVEVKTGADVNTVYDPQFVYGEAVEYLSHNPKLGNADTMKILRSIMTVEYTNYNDAVVIESDA